MDQDNLQIKKSLIKHILNILENNINDSLKAIQSIKASRDNDTKSSAGDKHETSRAMMQLELEQNEKQLHKHLKFKNEITQINIDLNSPTITIGSLVLTNEGTYFISAGLGSITINGSLYYAISSASPLGSQLINKKSGHEIIAMGRTIKIISFT